MLNADCEALPESGLEHRFHCFLFIGSLMPQPLTNFSRNLSIFLGNNTDSPSHHRPDLALKAMSVIAEWSILESFMSSLFAALLLGDDGRAAAIFSTIRSQQGQRDAIKAAVDLSALDQNKRDIISAVFSIYEKASKPRNKIAHWVWGYSPELPDAVLLADPNAMAAFHAKIAAFTRTVSTAKNYEPRPEIDKSRIFAWNAADFETASEKIQRAMDLASQTTLALLTSAPLSDPILLQLSNEPDLRAELERLNRDRQNDQ